MSRQLVCCTLLIGALQVAAAAPVVRTEAAARAVAQRNRAERARHRKRTGQPVEVIANYGAAQIRPVPESLGVSPFYTKYVDAMGIPVLSSEQAPDDALLVVRDIINSMLAERPDYQEIRAAYDSAMAAGKYQYENGRKHYATTNPSEYWAEGVQWWFYSNFGECFKGNVRVESPDDFKAYDARLYELIGRVFKTHHIPMDIYHARRVRPVSYSS